MSAKQAVIGAGGAGLLVVNYWTGPQRHTINDAVLNSKATPKQQKAAHAALVRYGAAVLVLAGAVLLAGISDAWASVMVTIVLGLWALWAVQKYAPPN